MILLADSHCGFMWEVMVAARQEVGVSKIFQEVSERRFCNEKLYAERLRDPCNAFL